jgi:hypothetical protein
VDDRWSFAKEQTHIIISPQQIATAATDGDDE